MVVLSTLLRFWQEAKSNKAADALKAMVSNTATVLRRDEGKRIELPIKQLVPGDLIVLSYGDKMGQSGGTNTISIVRVGEPQVATKR